MNTNVTSAKVNPIRAARGSNTPGSGVGSPLPCLYSNNSIETSKDSDRIEQIQALAGILSPYHKRAAHTLFSNVDRLISLSKSENHIGFLTLTFPDNVTDHKDAYSRFRSFNTNYLATHGQFGEWIAVKERQKRGAWHYHLLIQTKHNIRAGLSFKELEKGIYSSANDYLKSLWSDLRHNLPKYGLGRSELLPIKSNKEAMARYLGKYISKHIGKRTPQDKGVRLVNYSRSWSKNSVNFAWVTDNAKEWRRKVALFAQLSGCDDTGDLAERWGPNWAYNCLDLILKIDDYNQDAVYHARATVPF